MVTWCIPCRIYEENNHELLFYHTGKKLKRKFSLFYQCAETLVCHDQYLVKEATFVYSVCVVCVQKYKCVTYILYSMLTIAILHIVYYFCYNFIMRLKHHTVKLDTLQLHYLCT